MLNKLYKYSLFLKYEGIILKGLSYSLLCFISLFPQKNLFAYDKDGQYVVGGGVGGVICSEYISLLSQAQLRGGLTSAPGAYTMNSYSNYILGFQTGYNISHLGEKDIFSEIGGVNPSNKALFLIEDWCKKNPEKRFGEAVIKLAEKFMMNTNN